ncbi:MAG TPA: XRE family transcriptional regulator, partial [Flavobacteriaceae bacterium]|nr:XRE family transcriptional regulator [Flavobacteriaceae bacterium]
INQIGRIERAEINTTLKTIFKIAKALDIEISVFFSDNQ